MKYAVGYQLMDSRSTFFDLCQPYLDSIAEIYFPWVYQPSGREVIGEDDFMLDYTAADRLIHDLRFFKKVGKKIDLLFNSNCYGADAVSKRLEGEVYSIIEYLTTVVGDVDVVTTTSPVVAYIIKSRYPDIRTRASVNMHIGTVCGMRYLADVFDEYLVQREYNRDIEYLKKLKQWADSNGKNLHILANSGCLAYCSGQTFHNNIIAHRQDSKSRYRIEAFSGEDGRPANVCWNFFGAQGNLIDLLRATWIRPEDVGNYEDIFDTMKLATRMHPKPELIIKAYAQGFWKGDLTDLFEPQFSSVIAPRILDNTAFGKNWFQMTSACGRRCDSCSYCEDTYHQICKEMKQ
jgi:collagenase-like PrtC family protease